MEQSNNGRYADYRRDLRIEMIKHSVLKQQMDTTGHNRWLKQTDGHNRTQQMDKTGLCSPRFATVPG